MGFFGAYFGVIMCVHWLAAGQEREERYSRCVDYYKMGNTTDGNYDLEILPRIVLSVYCKDMNTGEPSEYISLTSSRERNYASYDKLLGSPSACPPTVPQQSWDEWGKTNFTRIRFDFDSWLVTTNDFSYATSVEDGSDIPYGQGGDNQTTQTCPFRGDFNIDLTSTPFQVDPQVTWSWEGPMSNNHSVSFSNLRQSVSGRCGGLPGICFPVLPSNRSIARLRLRLVSTHPCLTENPCEHLGKCFVRDASAYDCLCLPGSRRSNCEQFLDGNEFNFCAQEKGLLCQNSATCENIVKNAITTYGGDGSQETCQFPSTWLGKPVTECVSDCSVGPPFACSAHTYVGVGRYIRLGSWTPGIVYTLEGWFRPTVDPVGRKTIMGNFHYRNEMGITVDNGMFAFSVVPDTGNSKSYQTRTIAYVNQWHYVAMTVDGANARLYVNGSLLATVRTRRFFLSPPTYFSLGGSSSGRTKFVGDIKSFTVWKRVLEKKEIVDHYNDPVKDVNTTHDVIYNRLLAHYDFCMNNDAQPDCRGTDWGHRDWSPVDGDVVSGVHCNVRTFTIKAFDTVTVAPWSNYSANLGESGTFQLYAHDIIINGTLTATGVGYKGGEKPTTKFDLFGKQGGSYWSAGKANSNANGGGGGGGRGKPGGGGGYGTAGEPGVSENQDGVGEGGGTYGDYLSFLVLGSGGGSGSSNVNASVSVLYGGKGGNGGGALVLDARNSIRVAGHVSANGEDGESGGAGGGGGGGSGGSIQLRGLNIVVDRYSVTAIGGGGGCGTLGCGGQGGSGRIRIFSDSFSGKTSPSSINGIWSYRESFDDRALLARQSISISQMNSSNDLSVYHGCREGYNHLSYRVPITSEETEMMTPDFCRQKCYAKNYKFYGVQNASQCFCSNVIESGSYIDGLVDESACNLPCPGSKNLTCGGLESSSTYGPITQLPAWFGARSTCKPWCPVGFSRNSNQVYSCAAYMHRPCNSISKKGFLFVPFWDFKCYCSSGWHGKLCELPCSKGKYGPYCEKDCKCLNNAGCDSVSGTCNCFPGWAGPTCSPRKFGPDCNTSCKCVDRCTLDSCPRESLDFTIEMESEKMVINNSLNCLGNSSASSHTAVRAGNSSLNGTTSTSMSLTVIHAFNVSAVDEYLLRLVVYVPREKVFPASIFVEFTDRGRLLFYIPNSNFVNWVNFGGCFTFVTSGLEGLKLYINESGFVLDKISWTYNQSLSTCDRSTGKCRCDMHISDSQDSSVPQLTIIMSVISSVLALIIFGAIVACIHRKRHRLAYPAFDLLELCDDWEIRRGDLFMLDKIGQGAFGVVLKAQLYCKSLPRSSLHDPDGENKKIVACKMMKGPCEQDSDFMDEIKLMKRVGQHPHIVGMVACITSSQPLCLVVEYCCHGDLLSNLQKGRFEHVKSQQDTDRSCPGDSEDWTFRNPCTKLSSSCGSKLDEDQEMSEHAFKDEENVEGMFTASDLLSFAWQIASGMEYLAGKGLVHRDLACRNVLVCENNLLKVSDFGLTRAVYQDGVYLQKKAMRLPLRWMSIEAITHRIFTEKSDVWSFGVVVWEICTLGGFPYSCMSGKKFISHLRRGNRLACPKSCTKELYTLMTECWCSDPQQRPTFNVLVQKLGDMLESEQPNAYIDLDISNSDWDLDSITEMTESSESSEKSAASVDCEVEESQTADK